MKKAFTLIELLIVVAIIAILAAIAVPNFLEAQTRAKVSRAKADMRTLETGLTAYRVDNNAFPSGNAFGLVGCRDSDPCSGDPSNKQGWVLEFITTPVAYLTTSFIQDPFKARFRSGGIDPVTGVPTGTPRDISGDPNPELAELYLYYAIGPSNGNPLADEILTHAYGDFSQPDDGRANGYFALVSTGPDSTNPAIGGVTNGSATEAAVTNNIYDSSNGTVSYGSIYRVNGQNTGNGFFFEQANANR